MELVWRGGGGPGKATRNRNKQALKLNMCPFYPQKWLNSPKITSQFYSGINLQWEDEGGAEKQPSCVQVFFLRTNGRGIRKAQTAHF